MRPVDVSLIALIATPEKYDGQLVRVIGFLRIGFEMTAIYPHEQDCLIGATRNGLWVGIDPEKTEMDWTYVLLEGAFRAGDHGHMGAYSGAIRDVSRLDLRVDTRRRRPPMIQG